MQRGKFQTFHISVAIVSNNVRVGAGICTGCNFSHKMSTVSDTIPATVVKPIRNENASDLKDDPVARNLLGKKHDLAKSKTKLKRAISCSERGRVERLEGGWSEMGSERGRGGYGKRRGEKRGGEKRWIEGSEAEGGAWGKRKGERDGSGKK